MVVIACAPGKICHKANISPVIQKGAQNSLVPLGRVHSKTTFRQRPAQVFPTTLKAFKAADRVRSHRFAVVAAGNVSSSSDPQYDYDFFVIGSGSGGTRASRFASQMGARVAVCDMPFNPISSDNEGGVGGTCVLRGCVPKKLFVYGSEYTEHFKDAAGFGWEGVPTSPSLNWGKMMSAKTSEIERLHGIYKKLLDNAGVDLIVGRGTIVDAHTVDVDGKKITAKNICVAVGGKPHMLDIPGAEHCISSDQALCLEQFPGRVVVVGAGYIACEFAGIFEGYGAETHLVYRADLPLRGFDGECREFLAEQMAQKGVNMHPGSSPTEIVKNGDGSYTVKLKKSDGSTSEISADVVMMATGRRPRTANLGLEQAGVELAENGAIKVDEYSRTSVPSIFAIGDVTDRMNLTPVALMEGMAVARTLFGGNGPVAPNHENIASAVFTQPPLATVGMTEEEAAEALGDLDIYTSSFRPMRNTVSGSPGRAFMKLIVDANTDKVVGCHMVGPDSAEIMQGMGVAVKMGVTKTQLDTVVGIHPSSAEEFVTMRTKTREVRQKEAVKA
uniref:Glutathione reductase n=1 Tax=Tetraselmis sp. GSL018 TaxID=582737 RepID=A0A061S6M6_9CHLO|mmetsp:Transcript_24499/g.58252  ORF Transcript_24499/g.58252 Transcript_24499/m.58252 type:complete len:558 (-) Transcript_24499:264-1937(-)